MTSLTPSESTDGKIDQVQLQVLLDAVEIFKIKVEELREAGAEDFKKEQLIESEKHKDIDDEQEEIRNFFLTESLEKVEEEIFDIVIPVGEPTEYSLIASLTYITDEEIQKRFRSITYWVLFFQELLHNLNLWEFYWHKFINLENISKIYLYYKNNSDYINRLENVNFDSIIENLADWYILEILQNSDIQVEEECNNIDLPKVVHERINWAFKYKKFTWTIYNT